MPSANGGGDGVNDEGEAVRGSAEGCGLPAGEEAREDETAGRVDGADAVHAPARAAVNESAGEEAVAQPEDEGSGRFEAALAAGAGTGV